MAAETFGIDVGAALLAGALAAGRRALAVVGTAKNVGKTVTIAAVCDALVRRSQPFGLASIGRDGEAVDALDGAPKPRLFLRPGAIFATARPLLPAHPACELVDLLDERSALGTIALAKVRMPGYFEIAGPASAAAMRRVVRRLHAHGAEFVAIDGAVDRVAALGEADAAVVVATGAAGGPTQARVVDEVRALVSALRIPTADPAREMLVVDGALSAALAAQLVKARERRQVVVRDPTRIAVGGRALASFARDLDLRCERPMHVIACTVAPMSAERAFEPAAFLCAVADATGLPCYDVYASACAAAPARKAS